MVKRIKLGDIQIDLKQLKKVLNRQINTFSTELEKAYELADLITPKLGEKSLSFRDTLEYLIAEGVDKQSIKEVSETEVSINSIWAKEIQKKIGGFGEDIQKVIKTLTNIAEAQVLSQQGVFKEVSKEAIRNNLVSREGIAFYLGGNYNGIEVLTHEDSKLRIFIKTRDENIDEGRASQGIIDVEGLFLVGENGELAFYNNSIRQGTTERDDTEPANLADYLGLSDLLDAYTEARLAEELRKENFTIEAPKTVELGLTYKYSTSVFLSQEDTEKTQYYCMTFVNAKDEIETSKKLSNFANNVWNLIEKERGKQETVVLIEKSPCIIDELRVGQQRFDLELGIKDRIKIKECSEKREEILRKQAEEKTDLPIVYDRGSGRILYPVAKQEAQGGKGVTKGWATVDDLKLLTKAIFQEQQGENSREKQAATQVIRIMKGKQIKCFDELIVQLRAKLSKENQVESENKKNPVIIFVNLQNEKDPFRIVETKEELIETLKRDSSIARRVPERDYDVSSIYETKRIGETQQRMSKVYKEVYQEKRGKVYQGEEQI